MTYLRNLGTAVFEWRPGRLARHGGALLGWMLLRAAAQAGTVVLLARTLAAQTYGEFVAVIAVAGFAVPLAGLGLSNMVLRNVARDPQGASWYLGRAATIWTRTLLPLAAAAIGIALLLLPKGLPVAAMAAAICGELLASSLTELAGRYRQRGQHHELAGEGFCRGHADFGAGQRLQHGLALARNRRRRHVDHGQRVHALRLGVAQCALRHAPLHSYLAHRHRWSIRRC